MRSIGDRFSARKSSPSTLTLMREVFIEGGLIRKLWSIETNAYRDHLLRLDPESRRNRFNATIADDTVRGLTAAIRPELSFLHRQTKKAAA